MTMTELQAVNLILRQNGFERVNSLGSGQERSSDAQETLHEVRREILSHRLGFNELKTDLNVINGKVLVPDSYLTVTFPKVKHEARLNDSDNKRYVWDIEADEWETTKVENVRVAHDVTDFTKIPENFARWIAWAAAADYHFSIHRTSSEYLNAKAARARQVAINRQTQHNVHTTTGATALLSKMRGDA